MARISRAFRRHRHLARVNVSSNKKHVIRCFVNICPYCDEGSMSLCLACIKYSQKRCEIFGLTHEVCGRFLCHQQKRLDWHIKCDPKFIPSLLFREQLLKGNNGFAKFCDITSSSAVNTLIRAFQQSKDSKVKILKRSNSF
jgi:hypothetical protein